MNRRLATGIILVVLSVPAFLILATQGGAANPAKNTTAFTCVENGGAKDFGEAHCDEAVAAGTGKFGHVAIEKNTLTDIVVSNEKTEAKTTKAAPAIWIVPMLGFEFVCSTVAGEGSLKNEEPVAGSHQVKGSILIKHSNCEVKQPAGCQLMQPIEFDARFEGVEGLGAAANEMGVEFRPTEGTNKFGTITLLNCAAAGAYPITGTAISTGTPPPAGKFSGATWTFTEAMTFETLKVGGKPTKLNSPMTMRMKPVGGVQQNPIALTTVTG